MKQSTTIRDMLMNAYGVNQKDAESICMALKRYMSIYGRNWRREMQGDWLRAYYPHHSEKEGCLLQAVRNSRVSGYVVKLTGPKLKAEMDY